MDASLQALRESTRFVFLDRDGVINRKLPEGQYVTSPHSLTLYPGTASAIAALNRAGLKVLVVTNQRGIALGLYTVDDLEEIHRTLADLLGIEGARIDRIYYCPHDRHVCDCRKPAIGMFRKAFADFPGAHANNSVMIGDSISDIEAGVAAGMRTVFIAGDPTTRPEGSVRAEQMAEYTFPSLSTFVEAFLD